MRSWIGLGEKEEAIAHFEHPGVLLDNRERASILFSAMRQLPENQRIAFTLIKAEGLTYDETSEIMNISVKALESLMHRAKENLRTLLQHYHASK